ncbi:MAG: DEAD/DEAH box helicase [Sphingobacteriales bacterium]|nr:DEAD/DEAH box helicase [Sphingobacteriales bacterium]
MTFDDFQFDYELLDGLEAMGFNKPTPIQELAIPVILANKDLIACAQTGTGKTAAYVLPIIDKILASNHSHLNTLILAPTRELAVQIDQQVQGFSYYVPVSSIAIYGGGDGAIWDQQKKALKAGADIIIATPGRLISQLASGDIKLDKLEHLILDEADRMLDMGFYDDIIKIISYLPKQRQTILFSATMPPKIRTLAAKILYKPEEISIAISKPAAGILQQAYLTYDTQKIPLLGDIFKANTYQSVIVFAGTKERVKSLQFELKRIGLKAKSFHSDLEQKEREDLMNEFRSRKVQVLIGTDILSRGIDVDGIDLVVNFDVPPDPEDYVHRIGRTARAESKGTAITFINEKDQKRFHAIETLIEREIPKLPLPTFLGEAPVYAPNTRRAEPKRGFKPRRK